MPTPQRARKRDHKEDQRLDAIVDGAIKNSWNHTPCCPCFTAAAMSEFSGCNECECTCHKEEP